MTTMTSTPGIAATAAGSAPPRPRLTPNLFGICFGVAGLAEAWGAAIPLGLPAVVADVLWVATGLLWAVTVTAYLRDVIRGGRLRTELTDPVLAPFVPLLSIVAMLLAVALAEHVRTAGVVLFVIGIVATVALGGWLTGQWILAEMTLAQWHPGYFLPTVAGGLLASDASSALGYGALARMMFGYGILCWVLLGSILLLRLLTQPALPTPLLPTMAIEVAPPVVAGIAWFDLNGARPDTLALALAGYAVLMALVQLRLLPAYRTVPFGPGWWAFSFSYAAVFVDAIRWLDVEHAAHARTWAAVLLTMVSVALLALVVRTVVALSRGTFWPRAVAPAPVPEVP